MKSPLKPVSHYPITESEGTQSVVQSDEICSNCFGPFVSIPLLDCWVKSLCDSKDLPPIVRPSLTCQTILPINSDYYFVPTQVLPLARFYIWFYTGPQTYDGYSALHTQNSMYLNGWILSVEFWVSNINFGSKP